MDNQVITQNGTILCPYIPRYCYDIIVLLCMKKHPPISLKSIKKYPFNYYSGFYICKTDKIYFEAYPRYNLVYERGFRITYPKYSSHRKKNRRMEFLFKEKSTLLSMFDNIEKKGN